MSEHTKGPWLVRPTGDEHGQWSEVIAMDAGPFDAATGICETYREEDARLIAAAPDLLRELADLVDLLESDAEGIKTKYARAAIAKATGEAES